MIFSMIAGKRLTAVILIWSIIWGVAGLISGVYVLVAYALFCSLSAIIRRVRMERHRKASAQGDARSQFFLGKAYANGTLYIPKDNSIAVELYSKSAEQGFAPAQIILGKRYAEGNGVSRNHSRAIKWLHMASEQGYGYASYNLGIICLILAGRPAIIKGPLKTIEVQHEFGDFVYQEDANAIKWFEKAVAQGYKPAKKELKRIANLRRF